MAHVVEPRRNPDLAGVKRAHEKLRSILPPTPLLPLDIAGRRIWCKAESEHPVRAFKIRGAWHRLTDLDATERAAGVVAFSSGNHAQGVAWAAQRLGIAATIVMPSDAPQLKLEGTRTLGAEVILYDRKSEDRVAIAERIAVERGAVLVPSFDDPWVIEGQGSAALEAAEQLGFSPDLIVAPCGGGGLASGLALAIPGAKVAIVEPEGWDDMRQSLAAGRIVPVAKDAPPTACDAIMTAEVSPLTYGILRDRGADAFAVSEAETAAAMRLARDALGLTIEPGGAVALAVVMRTGFALGTHTVVVLSGGNVDPALFAEMTR